MISTPFTIVLFGPVNGVNTFALPKLSIPQDVNFQLPTYEIVTKERARTLRLVRCSDQGIWIASHTQVYDKYSSRTGHTFGVGIYLRNVILNSIEIYKILDGITEFLKSTCVEEGKFIDDAWNTKAKPEFEARFPSFVNEVTPKLKPIQTGGGLSSGNERIGYREVSDWSNKREISYLIEWCLVSPGASQFKTFYVGEPNTIPDDKSVVRVESLEQENQAVFDNQQNEYENNLKLYTANHKSEIQRLQTEYNVQKQSIANQKLINSDLQRDLGKLYTNSQQLNQQPFNPTSSPKIKLSLDSKNNFYPSDEFNVTKLKIKQIEVHSIANSIIVFILFLGIIFGFFYLVTDYNNNYQLTSTQVQKLDSQIQNLKFQVDSLSMNSLDKTNPEKSRSLQSGNSEKNLRNYVPDKNQKKTK